MSTYEGPQLNASVSSVKAARGSTLAGPFFDAVQNALNAPHDQPSVEFGMLCRVAEELAEKSGIIETDLGKLDRRGQQAVAELRQVYKETLTVFGGRDEMRENLRVLCWAALADTNDPTETAEQMNAAAENPKVKADPDTAKNASEWIGQPLADFIDDCLLVSDRLEDWERIVRRRPRQANVLAQLRGDYVPPRLRENQPPSPKPDDEQELSEHPEIG